MNSRRIRWIELVTCMRKMRSNYKILLRTSKEEATKVGRRETMKMKFWVP
jgi:hypothetical protein